MIFSDSEVSPFKNYLKSEMKLRNNKAVFVPTYEYSHLNAWKPSLLESYTPLLPPKNRKTKVINKLFIFLLIIPAISHCLECNYEFKEKGGSYKVQLKIKNKNDVLLQLFTNGIMTESCKGKSENYSK